NQWIGNRLPRWRAMRAAGAPIALGTDSLASCQTLDVLADVAVLARDGADPTWLLEAATRTSTLGLPPGPWIEVGDTARWLRDPTAWLAFEAESAPVRRLS